MPSQSTARYLLDTNILVHYARGDALARFIEAKYHLRNSPTSPIVSIVTVGELITFATYNNWGAAKVAEMHRTLNHCVIVPLDLAGIVEAYAELKNFSRQVGCATGDNDLWIAATAKITGALLLTTDKDFDHLSPELINRDWIDPARK